MKLELTGPVYIDISDITDTEVTQGHRVGEGSLCYGGYRAYKVMIFKISFQYHFSQYNFDFT